MPASGLYSFSLSISQLSLSISTTEPKRLYYVMLYFYSQLRRLLRYNIGPQQPCGRGPALTNQGHQVLDREASGEHEGPPWETLSFVLCSALKSQTFLVLYNGKKCT